MAKKTNLADKYEVICAEELARLRLLEKQTKVQIDTNPDGLAVGLSLRATLGLLLLAHLCGLLVLAVLAHWPRK